MHQRIAMVTPPGRLQPAVLAAAKEAGVTEIWRVGGAQAVAALAYGAGPIKPVDKIVGPGNAYVTAAKRRVYGTVGIDALAGPSEIVVVADGKLSCQLYQRSADIFLGVPFNIASYALLTLMVAQVCDLEPGEFIWTGGDCHLYANHIEQTDLQLSREPLPLPVMKLNPAVKDLLAFRFEDFELVGYQSHPHIKAPVAV